jgi:hypothetical protein
MFDLALGRCERCNAFGNLRSLGFVLCWSIMVPFITADKEFTDERGD